MSSSDYNQLTPEAREAVRDFVLRVLTVPAIVITVISFALGFFINGAARNEAYTDAYKEASKEIRALTADAAAAKTEAGTARDRANETLKETSPLLDTARRLKTDFETLTNPQELRRQLADQLSKDTDFTGRVLAGIDSRIADFKRLEEKLLALEASALQQQASEPRFLAALLLGDAFPDVRSTDVSAAILDPKDSSRVWFIAGSRIGVVEDTNGDWKGDKLTIFADGFPLKDATHIAVSSSSSRSVYVRHVDGSQTILFDTDGDGRADKSVKNK